MKVVSFILSALASLTAAQQATLCKDFEYYSSNGYELNNNIWGRSSATSGSQCTYVNSVSQTGAKWTSNWQWQGGRDNVKSYVYSGRQITKKPVSQYNNLETEAYWVYDTNNIRCNVAYDLFTSANVNHPTSSGDYELMVWYVLHHLFTFLKSRLLHILTFGTIIGSAGTMCTPLDPRKGWSTSPAANGNSSTASTAT